MYWSPVEIEPVEIRVVDNKQFIPPHGDHFTSGEAMFATSYALLLYLAHGEFEASRPIAHWLVEFQALGVLVSQLYNNKDYLISVFIYLYASLANQ